MTERHIDKTFYVMQFQVGRTAEQMRRDYPAAIAAIDQFEASMRAILRDGCEAMGGDSESHLEIERQHAEMLALLRDVWAQFSIQRPDGTRWAGGLSTMEDVEAVLRRSGRI